VITLIIFGKYAEMKSPALSAKQVEREKTRPERLPLEKIASLNKFQG
jgi:hypothetical protein